MSDRSADTVAAAGSGGGSTTGRFSSVMVERTLSETDGVLRSCTESYHTPGLYHRRVEV